MEEWCSLEEVYDAYLDCRKRKRTSRSCSRFERNEMCNIYKLWKELNDGSYEIGYSNAFCVTRPKTREVFAAEFKDRIVHHLLIRRTIHLFETHFIYDTYNCRKGKGTDFGVRRMQAFAKEYKDGRVMICDLKGFFMSINKPLLADMMESFLRERYKKADIEKIVWLMRMIILHNPQDKCRKKGNLQLWDKLDKNKSLFTNDPDCGQAIGNLTSQINANFYLSALDFILQGAYGRYVDDFVMFSNSKQELLDKIPMVRRFLKEELYIELHPRKLYLQEVRKGFRFVGSVIKGGRIYAGRRTIGNATTMILYHNKLKDKERCLERFVQRYNSYMGYLVHRQSYAIRWKLWNLVSEEYKQYVYMTSGLAVMKIRNKYKPKTIILKNYGNKHRKEKRIRRDSACIYPK